MSRQERERLKIMAGVKAKELTLVAAAGLMGVCYRQGKRIWRRYQDAGDAGLVHQLRGQPSARRKPSDLREQVLALCAEERYAGFGPTLMAEHLLRAKLVADRDAPAHGASAQAKAPAMAGTQTVLWSEGATGRLASRLVRGTRPQVRPDGDGG